MADTRTRSSSGGGWLCCVRPATADEPEVLHSSSSLPKDACAHGTHVTAVAHSSSTADHREEQPEATQVQLADAQLADAAPASSDQAPKRAQPAAAAAGAAAGNGEAAVAAKAVTRHVPHQDLRHLMAAAHNRPYTDADWDACLAALEQVKQQNQALALQQLQNGGGKPLHRSSFASATSDVFHDAFSHTMSDASVSEAEHREVEQYLAELEMLRGPAPGPELSCTPTCEPNPPLLFAPKSWKYCQVDPRPFCAYWERDAVRSTPFPLPSHKQMKLNKLARACHESIPGMWLRVEGKQFVLTATPSIIAIPGVMNYHEYYNMDSTRAHWALRRDISLGRSEGEMFMTTDGILIFRVFSSGLFTSKVDCIYEDYMRVEDNGNVIITQQWSRCTTDGSTATQYLVGRKAGSHPPKKH